MITEIKKDMKFEDGLKILGISFEKLIENINLINEPPSNISPVKAISLENGITNYLAAISERSEVSVLTYKGVLYEFLAFMNMRWQNLSSLDNTVGNIKKSDIQKFLSSWWSPDKSPYTFNKKLAVLCAFFRKYLVEEEEILKKSPTTGIRRKSGGSHIIRFLSKSEQEKILIVSLKNKETGKRDFIIIFLALNTGLRLSEIAALNVGDIDIRKDCIYVRNGKGGKPREVYLTDDVKEILIGYIKNDRIGLYKDNINNVPLFVSQKGNNFAQRLQASSIEKMVIRVFRKCGIKQGAVHRLRHSFAINALESGLNIVEIMPILGHENITTTVKYLRLDNKKILEKIKTFFPLAYVSVNNVLEQVKYGKKE